MMDTTTSALLSLPNEILCLISQYIVLAEVGPERRLHPCTNARHMIRGQRRREISCPPLFLTCKDLHHICCQAFYQNVTIVLGLDYHSQPYYFRCYPTPSTDKDVLSIFANRTGVLPYVQNLELMVARTNRTEEITFIPYGKDLNYTVNTVCSMLPALGSLGFSLGLGDVADHTLAMWSPTRPGSHDDSSVGFGYDLDSLSCEYLALNDVLEYRPAGLEITSLRLWLTTSITQCIFVYIRRSWTEARAQAEEELGIAEPEVMLPPSFIRSLRTHVKLRPIAELQQLKQLDIFIPLDRSHLPNRFVRREWGIQKLPNDAAAVELIKTYLKSVFAHVDHVRLWKAHSPNITSGEYEAF